jgi:hypothetical protein
MPCLRFEGTHSKIQARILQESVRLQRGTAKDNRLTNQENKRKEYSQFGESETMPPVQHDRPGERAPELTEGTPKQRTEMASAFESVFKSPRKTVFDGLLIALSSEFQVVGEPRKTAPIRPSRWSLSFNSQKKLYSAAVQLLSGITSTSSQFPR